jgi:hypothetical protein
MGSKTGSLPQILDQILLKERIWNALPSTLVYRKDNLMHQWQEQSLFWAKAFLAYISWPWMTQFCKFFRGRVSMFASLPCPYQTCICTKVRQLFRSRIHERTISLRFLYGFLKPQGRGYGYLSGFSSFLLYRNRKRVGEFEEIEISSKAESES